MLQGDLAGPRGQQDMDLVDILWRQDVDMGAGRETFDGRLRQKEASLRRRREREAEECARLQREQEAELIRQLRLDEETGEAMPRPLTPPPPANEEEEEEDAGSAPELDQDTMLCEVADEALSFSEYMELLADPFPLEHSQLTLQPSTLHLSILHPSSLHPSPIARNPMLSALLVPPTQNPSALPALSLPAPPPPLPPPPTLAPSTLATPPLAAAPPPSLLAPPAEQAWLDLLTLPELHTLSVQVSEILELIGLPIENTPPLPRTPPPAQNTPPTASDLSHHPPLEDFSPPPLENLSHPPLENVSHPPLENLSHPPLENVSHPPLENLSHPPLENLSHPPLENLSHPPLENLSHPPLENPSHPPLEDLSRPPPKDPSPAPLEDLSPLPPEDLSPAPLGDPSRLPLENLSHPPLEDLCPLDNLSHPPLLDFSLTEDFLLQSHGFASESPESGKFPESRLSGASNKDEGSWDSSESETEEMESSPGSSQSEQTGCKLHQSPASSSSFSPTGGPTSPDSRRVTSTPTDKTRKSSRSGGRGRGARLSRDEQRARALAIPFAVGRVVDLPVDDFNELMTRHALSEPQLALVRDIRRRGKNKVAAQNCRKRKMASIGRLEEELEELQRERDCLLGERAQGQSSLVGLRDRLSSLYLEVFGQLRDERGRPYSPQHYSLQQASDGSMFLVPRPNKSPKGAAP